MNRTIHFFARNGSNSFIITEPHQKALRKNKAICFHIKLPRINSALVHCHVEETLLHLFIRYITCRKSHTGNFFPWKNRHDFSRYGKIFVTMYFFHKGTLRYHNTLSGLCYFLQHFMEDILTIMINLENASRHHSFIHTSAYIERQM